MAAGQPCDKGDGPVEHPSPKSPSRTGWADPAESAERRLSRTGSFRLVAKDMRLLRTLAPTRRGLTEAI